MNSKIKKIGILDGMGAFAGARFFQLTLEKISAKKLTLPEIILNAVSVDDFIADPSKIKPAQAILSSRVKAFNRQGVSMIVMACNTAHIIHPELRRISQCEFPSIIDLVVKKAIDKKLSKIGILASPMTIKTKLYEDALHKSNIQAVIPDKKFQKLLEKIIRCVLNNTITPIDIKKFEENTRQFISQNNIDSLILGCTELPLVFPKDKFKNIIILDSLDILASAIVEHVKC